MQCLRPLNRNLKRLRCYAVDAKPSGTRDRPPSALDYRKPLLIPPTPASSNDSKPDSTGGATFREPLDPQRGYEASVRVAQGGKLDARYRPAARRVLAIMVALPFSIWLSWELFQRRYMGKEQKRITRDGAGGKSSKGTS